MTPNARLFQAVNALYDAVISALRTKAMTAYYPKTTQDLHDYAMHALGLARYVLSSADSLPHRGTLEAALEETRAAYAERSLDAPVEL